MSDNPRLNNDNFKLRQQPIHLYAINSMLYKNSVIYPSLKYSPNKISPTKLNSNSNYNNQIGSNFYENKVFNSRFSQKYQKLSVKMSLLEKNLNRLNGQNQALLQLFQRSDQFSKIDNLLMKLDQIKQKLKQNTKQKLIEQKRYQARCELEYDEYGNKIKIFQNNQIYNQKKLLSQIEKYKTELTYTDKIIEKYKILYQQRLEKINQLHQNAKKCLKIKNQNLKNQSKNLISLFEIQKIVEKEQKFIQSKLENIKIKLGELQCISQHELYLDQSFLHQSIQINQVNRLTPQSKIEILDQLEFKSLTQERHFVSNQSKNRLMFLIQKIDADIYNLQQQIQQNTFQNFSQSKSQIKQKFMLSKKKNNSILLSKQILEIQAKLKKLRYEMLGFKDYFQESTQKINKINNFRNSNSQIQSEQLQEQVSLFMQWFNDFESKFLHLEQSVNFFKSKS